MGYNYVFSIGKGIDQMGKNQKIMIEGIAKREPKNGCIPLCHSLKSSILEVVSIKSHKRKRSMESSHRRIGEKRRV